MSKKKPEKSSKKAKLLALSKKYKKEAAVLDKQIQKIHAARHKDVQDLERQATDLYNKIDAIDSVMWDPCLFEVLELV